MFILQYISNVKIELDTIIVYENQVLENQYFYRL